MSAVYPQCAKTATAQAKRALPTRCHRAVISKLSVWHHKIKHVAVRGAEATLQSRASYLSCQLQKHDTHQVFNLSRALAIIHSQR